MNLKQIEEISYNVIIWCSIVFGKSKYRKDYPMVFSRYENGNCYGEYDTTYNIILVYSKYNKSLKQLVNTVIHEYMHYLQSPIWSTRYIKKYGARTSPYEKLAEKTAIESVDICIKDINTRVQKILKKRSKNGNIKSNKK